MTSFRRSFITCALIIGSLPAAFADQAAEMRADFEWFSQLGYQDIKDLPFVRGISSWSISSDGAKPVHFEGFLLADEGQTFRVLNFDFVEWTIPKEQRFAVQKPNHYETAKLEEYASELLARVSKPEARLPGLTAGPHFILRTKQFVIAWACFQKGLPAPAEKLYRATRLNENNPSGYGAHKDDYAAFRLQLERDIAHVEIWRIVNDFSNPEITRAALLKRLRAFPTHFPNSEHLGRTKNLATRLEPMIVESEARKARSPEEVAQLPIEEKIEEWIFQLRDLNAIQFSQPGWVDVLGWNQKTAANRLAECGDAAVPQLIKALSNQRLSRSVGFGRNFRFSHEILSVGDISLAIIERHAARRFRKGAVMESGEGVSETESVLKVVKEWWQERQEKGELKQLSDTTAEGEQHSPPAAQKLLDRYPQSAGAAILAGAKAAKENTIRHQLIKQLWKIEDASALEFLRQEVTEGQSLDIRATAAYQLLKRGFADPLLTLAAEWAGKSPSETSREYSDSDALLVCVLALSDQPAAIDALAKKLSLLPPRDRKNILESLDPKYPFDRIWQTGDHATEKAKVKFSPGTLQRMEHLLTAELENTASYKMDCFLRNTRFDHYRSCDHAAILLAEYWPDRYQFDVSASLPLREEQRKSCLEAWRKHQGTPSSPAKL